MTPQHAVQIRHMYDSRREGAKGLSSRGRRGGLSDSETPCKHIAERREESGQTQVHIRAFTFTADNDGVRINRLLRDLIASLPVLL